MNNDSLDARIEELESRLMHQEASIEELTRTLLGQGQQLDAQVLAMERLEAQLRSVSASNTLTSSEEQPPPHY